MEIFMTYEVKEGYIVIYFQELTEDIKSVFSRASAEVHTENQKALIKNEHIADLNIHEIKKLGLPPVYPHRLRVNTRGVPTTPAFSYEVKYLDEKSRQFYQVKRTGPVLNLDGQLFTLTNPHFSFLENLQKLSSKVKTPGARLKIWSQIIKHIPKEALDNKELLNICFVKADRFCVDRKKLSDNDFHITPELIYSDEENNEEKSFTHQLSSGISQDFKEAFLNINSVDPYYKVGNHYIQVSEPLRACLKIIKKINREPLAKKKAFYLNPMERIKSELPNNLSEKLLENIFFETEQFKSSRISHLGKWVPKVGIYIDPDNKNPWFPKDDIAVKIKDSLFHFAPDDMDTLLKDLENAKKEGKDNVYYKDQVLPVDDAVISELKNVKDNIVKESQKIICSSEEKEEKQKISKLVAIIKDNIDHLEYQSVLKPRLDLAKNIPQELKSKFIKYPHQKEGVLWLEENFIQGRPGALLADDMGLGKTFQALSFLYWYKKNYVTKRKPVLIVAPTGLLKNWQDEHEIHLFEHGGIGRKYKAYGESFRKARKESELQVIKEMEKSDWVLTTYEALRDHHTKFFIKISWGVLIFDEIQKIKNPNSLMTDASKALESDFSIGLTGTPLENSFIDLWCVSDCLYPKILGLLKDFHGKYIKNKPDNSAREIQKKLFQKNPPFILRRVKKDILKDLPERKVIPKKLDMTDVQKDIYSEVIRKAKNREYTNSLQALSLLKRFSIYVQDCFEGTDDEFIDSSAKLKFLFKTLEDIKNKKEKVLICVENRNLQKKIKSICDAKWSLNVKIINGDMPGERRKSTVDQFGKKDGFNIMIISPRAGGVGLNIVSANHIVHLERWWNPAVEDQSNDRIFRIGQKKPVFVYYPLAVHPDYRDESFDIVLNRLLENKKQMREQTLIPSEPDKQEQKEFYRTVVSGEEMYTDGTESFYKTEEWKALRRQVFQKYPPLCGRCGNKNNLDVDHVKPRSRYPELELNFDNLQILCRDCNLLKGTKDSQSWDFRDK